MKFSDQDLSHNQLLDVTIIIARMGSKDSKLESTRFSVSLRLYETIVVRIALKVQKLVKIT